MDHELDSELIDQELREAEESKLEDLGHEFKEFYLHIGELYGNFSQITLNRMQETGRPMHFLLRDGQLIANITRNINQTSDNPIPKEKIVSTPLTRRLFELEKIKREEFLDSVYDDYTSLVKRDTNFESSGSEQRTTTDLEYSDLLDKIRDLTLETGFVLNKNSSGVDESKRKKLFEISKELLHKLLSDSRISDEYKETIRSKLEKSEEPGKSTQKLFEFLDSQGLFEPYVDMADTGMAGTIFNNLGNLREKHWDKNITNPNFRSQIIEAYEIDNERFTSEIDRWRNVYSGKSPHPDTKTYSMTMFMLFSSRTETRRDGIVSAIPEFEDEYGEIKSIYNGNSFESAPVSSIQILLYLIESRLNGYLSPISDIDIDPISNSLQPVFDEVSTDAMDTVHPNWFMRNFSRNKSRITSDRSRIVLNRIAMKYVKEGSKKSSRYDFNPNQLLTKIMNSLAQIPDDKIRAMMKSGVYSGMYTSA